MTMKDFGRHLLNRIAVLSVLMLGVVVCSYEYQEATTLPHWCDDPGTSVLREC
jgi:hypothetical protein